MSALIDVDQLRTFIAIVETGSFTKAAEVVHKTQSAVSMQIKRLEERLDRPIFARDGRASKLTEDGERLLDYARRIIKLNVEALAAFDDAELTEVLNRTTEGKREPVNRVLARETLLELQTVVRQVPVASHVKDYAVRLIMATHPKTDTAAPISNQYLRFGSSPRGAQTLLLAGKVRALTQGRFNVSFDDIQTMAHAALRHRLILNFEAEAEGIEPVVEVLGRAMGEQRLNVARAERTAFVLCDLEGVRQPDAAAPLREPS
jgi:MoxR-like ATPase